MNAVAEIAPVITAANEALRRDFPLKPFAIRHKLAGHPLLTLRRIALGKRANYYLKGA